MQEEYIEQQPQGFQYIPPQHDMSTSESSLKYQLDPEEIINECRHAMLGNRKVWNSKFKRYDWIPQERGGCISEDGWMELESELRFRLSKIFKLTKLEDEAITNITIGVFNSLWDLLEDNYTKWEIKSITVFPKIINMITDAVYVHLKAAQNGEYLLFLKSTYNIMENRMDRTMMGLGQPIPQEKKGLVGSIKGMFR